MIGLEIQYNFAGFVFSVLTNYDCLLELIFKIEHLATEIMRMQGYSS